MKEEVPGSIPVREVHPPNPLIPIVDYSIACTPVGPPPDYGLRGHFIGKKDLPRHYFWFEEAF